MGVVIHHGDCRDVLLDLPDESVHCVVTSPPYFGLRDYGSATWEGGDAECDHVVGGIRTGLGMAALGAQYRGGGHKVAEPKPMTAKGQCPRCGARRVDRQIGLEPTPDAFVAELVAVFREVRRVLRKDGTLWLNLGDSYSSGGRATRDAAAENKGNTGALILHRPSDGLKPKDLIGIPWRAAFALQAGGWVLRQELIWAKSNPMPESVRDRCTKSHEQIFLFAKAKWGGPQPGRFAHISDADARWLAALIDAEGSIVVTRCKHDGRSDTFAPQVAMGGTSRALMEEFARIAGHGNLMGRPGQNAPMLCWQVANGIARDFLHRIYPWLIVKKRQARIGIYVGGLTYYRGGKTPERKGRSATEEAILVSLWARNKECNQFGDPDLSDVPEPDVGRWVDCERYFYDAEAVKEEQSGGAGLRGGIAATQLTPKQAANPNRRDGDRGLHKNYPPEQGRNRRSVWTIATQPNSEAHFAVMPDELAELCIKAGCPKGGTVLDPFAGAGTTGLVADRLGRSAILIELNPDYSGMAHKRIVNDAPLFAAVATV